MAYLLVALSVLKPLCLNLSREIAFKNPRTSCLYLIGLPTDAS